MSDRGGLPDDEPVVADFEEVIKRARGQQSGAAGADDGSAAAEAGVGAPSGGAVGVDGAAPATRAVADGAAGGIGGAVSAARVAATGGAEAGGAAASAGPARPVSPARAMAIYLTALRGLLNEATESRRAWVRQIGIMMQDARTRPMAMVSPMAGKIGSEQMSRFGELRERVQKLEPPPGCTDLQALLHGWLDRHMEVCQLLVDFGRNGDLGKLKASQGLLAEGRLDLQRFQAEYTKRVTALKRQVEATKKKRKAKWPFGRPKTE